MPDLLDHIATLQKAHDYFGKAESLYGNINTVRTAARIDPKDAKALKKLVGITDKETARLLSVLNARAKAAEATANATFPAIKSPSTAAWARWYKSALKSGLDSPEALKRRESYLKALKEYDRLLRERMGYCDILIKRSTAQIKVYKGLVAVHASVVKICKGVIVAPSGMSTAPQAEAMKILLKFDGVPAPANRIWKAHEKIVTKAKAEKSAREKTKKANDVWIKDLEARALRDGVKKALKALGVEI